MSERTPLELMKVTSRRSTTTRGAVLSASSMATLSRSAVEVSTSPRTMTTAWPSTWTMSAAKGDGDAAAQWAGQAVAASEVEYDGRMSSSFEGLEMTRRTCWIKDDGLRCPTPYRTPA